MKPHESQWYDAGYKTARKETIDKMLEIIDECEEDHDCGTDIDPEQAYEQVGWYADSVRCKVNALMEDKG